MNEEWRAVVGFEGIYEVSSIGRVRSVERTIRATGIDRRLKQRTLRQHLWSFDHYIVTLTVKETRTIARVADLMLAAFVGPAPEGQEAVHIDYDKANNILENLRYAISTDEEHYENPGNRKLVAGLIPRIRASTETHTKLAELYGVTKTTIASVRKRKTWKHIE